MYELINVLPPGNFAVFAIATVLFVIDCKELKLAQTTCINKPALLIFVPNWYIRVHLLSVKSYANEQKCKQWRHDESAHIGASKMTEPRFH